MAYKLLDMAQARSRRLDGAHLLPLPAPPSASWMASSTREGQQAEAEGEGGIISALPHAISLPTRS